MSEYTFGTTVSGDFDGVIARVTSALADEGFGVLATIDMSATSRAKIDLDMPRYTILGACNPPLAATALEADPEIGASSPATCSSARIPTGSGWDSWIRLRCSASSTATPSKISPPR